MSSRLPRYYRFADFVLDVREHTLLQDGEPAHLTPKTFETLLVLVQHQGSLIRKDDLIAQIWEGNHVTDNALTRCIKEVRSALGDEAKDPKFIETLPRVGYRFIAPVEPALSMDPGDSSGDGVEYERQSAEPARSGRPALVAAAVVIVSLAFYGVSLLTSSGKTEAVQTLAVLPFDADSSEAADNTELARGFAETLGGHLGEFKGFTLKPVSSTDHGTKHDLLATGQHLQVDIVIGGNLERRDNTLEAFIQVMDVEDRTTLLSQQYRQAIDQDFALLAAITEDVADAVGVDRPAIWESIQVRNGPVETSAFLEYVQGRHYLQQRTETDLRRAIQHFQRAIDSNANYTAAYSGMADALSSLGTFLPPRAVLPAAEETALKALALNPASPELLVSLAVIDANFRWDWEAAEARFEEAISIRPDYLPARTEYAQFLTFRGQYDRAITQLKAAEKLEPLSPLPLALHGWALLMDGQMADSQDKLNRALALDPDFVLTHIDLGLLELRKGNPDSAISAFEQAVELSGQAPDIEGLLGYTHAIAGNRQQAMAALGRLQAMSKDTYVTPFANALVYLGLGDTGQSVRWLEKAYGDRAWHMIMLENHFMFDPLRDDPKFTRLVASVRSGEG